MHTRVFNLVRDLWVMLGVTALFLVGMELLARGGFAVRDMWLNQSFELVDPSLRADVYADQPWARQFWRESALTAQASYVEWHSYVYWRRKPFQGQFVNVDARGLRRTWNATPTPEAHQVKIFLFGGSTLWGTGARDEYTIPSLLAKKLHAKNSAAWVVNFGESGYVSTQELLTLERELQAGNVPDLVVFYDGINDQFSATQQGVAGIPQNEYHRVWEFNQLNWRGAVVEPLALNRLARSLVSASARARQTPPNPPLADRVVDIYASNVRIVQALGREYGFQSAFYWQPTVYTKKTLSPWEKSQLDLFAEAAFFKLVNESAKPRLARAALANWRDLSDGFAEASHTVFIDAFHLSEAGNDRIADLILQTLPPASPRGK